MTNLTFSITQNKDKNINGLERLLLNYNIQAEYEKQFNQVLCQIEKASGNNDNTIPFIWLRSISHFKVKISTGPSQIPI